MARNAAQPPYQVIAESGVFSVSARTTPTLAPVRPPPQTLAPTRPAPLPESFIRTNERSYFAHEEIVVTFLNSNPRNGDWIGIFKESEPLNNLREGEFWMWVCGGKDRCSGPVSCNVFTIMEPPMCAVLIPFLPCLFRSKRALLCLVQAATTKPGINDGHSEVEDTEQSWLATMDGLGPRL